jgi:hypothetical protein
METLCDIGQFRASFIRRRFDASAELELAALNFAWVTGPVLRIQTCNPC